MNCGGSVNLDLGRKYLSFITQEWHTYGGVHVFRGEALEHLVAAVKAERGSKESLCEVKASLGLPTRGICLHCLQGIASGLYQEWVPVGYELKPAAAITVKGTLDLRIVQAYFDRVVSDRHEETNDWRTWARDGREGFTDEASKERL